MTPEKRPNQLDSPLLQVIFRYTSRAQVWVYRRTGGKIGGKWRIGAGFRKPVPTLLLEHIGRKSGKLFVAPLLYMPDGPNRIVVASQGGRPENPQWYRNLVANPDTHIEIGAERRAVHLGRTSGRGCGRGWSRPTPTSTPTRAGPSARFRLSCCSRASQSTD